MAASQTTTAGSSVKQTRSGAAVLLEEAHKDSDLRAVGALVCWYRERGGATTADLRRAIQEQPMLTEERVRAIIDECGERDE